MRRLRYPLFLALCLLTSMLLYEQSMLVFFPVTPPRLAAERGLSISLPHQVAETPTDAPYPFPTYYAASDLYDAFLYAHMPIHSSFPQGVSFAPDPPQSFLGFTDYSDGVHWYVVAVFYTREDAQRDVSTWKSTTHDTLFMVSRCVLVGDRTANTAVTATYQHLLTRMCTT